MTLPANCTVRANRVRGDREPLRGIVRQIRPERPTRRRFCARRATEALRSVDAARVWQCSHSGAPHASHSPSLRRSASSTDAPSGMYVFTALGPAAAERSMSLDAARISAIESNLGDCGPRAEWQARQWSCMNASPKLAYVSVEVVGQVLPVASPGPLPHARRTAATQSAQAKRGIRLVFIRRSYGCQGDALARHQTAFFLRASIGRAGAGGVTPIDITHLRVATGIGTDGSRIRQTKIPLV